MAHNIKICLLRTVFFLFILCGILTALFFTQKTNTKSKSPLIASQDCEVRRAIIFNPNVTESTLIHLTQHDADIGIRRDAQKRLDFFHSVFQLETSESLSPEEQELLKQAKHSIDPIQLTHIFDITEKNSHATSILDRLATNCFINSTLANKLYAKAQTLKNYPKLSIYIALAANPSTPNDILKKLSLEKNLAILQALTSNPNLPSDVIIQFMHYPDCKIRKKIICIPNTNFFILNQLQNDIDESVAFEAHQRLRDSDTYLATCNEMKKINSSCQKLLDMHPPAVEVRPNVY